MAEQNSRPEDYNEETEFDTFETQEIEQPQEKTYENYANKSNDTPEYELPEKYHNKEVKDIVAMHQNAEKLLGKQSQEVGELRKVVDDFIRSQTVQQQQKAPATPVDDDDDDDLEFFENPKKAISKMLENHPSVKQSREMSTRYAQQESVARLKSTHPDFQAIVQDSGFLEWVGKSKIRSQLLRNADQYDFDSADELFSSWKERQDMVSGTVEQEARSRKQAIKNASTGNAKGSNERPSRKIYRRADIVELMTKDPERYSALASEIREAYAEGRVR
tara:strand:+ start:2678 stop:3505 length:828 start_codon:yes stop_codon:yes gene_type:complete